MNGLMRISFFGFEIGVDGQVTPLMALTLLPPWLIVSPVCGVIPPGGTTNINISVSDDVTQLPLGAHPRLPYLGTWVNSVFAVGRLVSL